MKTTEKDIAKEIVMQMSGYDRENFTREGWYDGVSGMLQGDWEGADLGAVLDEIEKLIADPRRLHD